MADDVISLSQSDLDNVLNAVRADNRQNESSPTVSVSQGELEKLFGSDAPAEPLSPSSSESQDTDSERARKIAERKARSAAILAQANASSPKRITVIYGSTVKKSAEMDQLKEDSVIELDRASDEIVEILADGKPFAMGKLEVSNGKASVRIVRMITD